MVVNIRCKIKVSTIYTFYTIRVLTTLYHSTMCTSFPGVEPGFLRINLLINW